MAAILCRLVLKGAWTELYLIWWRHRTLKDPHQIYFRYPVCCSLSKPELLKVKFCTFLLAMKIRGMDRLNFLVITDTNHLRSHYILDY